MLSTQKVLYFILAVLRRGRILMTSNAKMKIMKLVGRAQRFFSKNAGFIFLFFLVNYFTMAWSLAKLDRIEVMVGYGFTLFLASFMVTALLQQLRRPLFIRLVKALLIVICFVPFFIESFVMYNYQALIGAGIVNSILETNSQEAVEFLHMYIGVKECAAVAVALVVLFYCRRFRVLSRIHISRRVQSRILALVLLVSFGYAVRMTFVYTAFFFDDILPIQRVYASTSVAVKNMQAYHKLSSQLSTDIQITENQSTIQNIVFILGESTNRNHMHLYGYNLPNTPNLDALNEKGELGVFRNVVSPHSTTIAVLSKLFTFCDHESDKDWYEYNNLIDVMNTAGYKTHWLSNQESSGIWGNIAQIYAEHSTMHKFTRIRDSHDDYGILDEELFPLIDDAIVNRSPDRNFYVTHLMGGHGLYYNRYPYSFNKFTADDISLDISPRYREIVAQYDNALYYNDYIVSNIIEKFRDKEALVIYVPDHGEAVYDEGGFAGHIEENPNRHMIEIPVIMWASPSFREKYPEKWAEIQAAVDRPYMTDDMIHTVLDLADIHTPEYDPAKSIVNRAFDASRPRIFNDLNYDTQILPGKIPEAVEE